MGDKAPNQGVLPQNEISSARNQLYLIEMLVKGALWKETTDNSDYCPGYWILYTNKHPIAEDVTYILLNTKKLNWYLTESFTLSD